MKASTIVIFVSVLTATVVFGKLVIDTSTIRNDLEMMRQNIRWQDRQHADYCKALEQQAEFSTMLSKEIVALKLFVANRVPQDGQQQVIHSDQ